MKLVVDYGWITVTISQQFTHCCIEENLLEKETLFCFIWCKKWGPFLLEFLKNKNNHPGVNKKREDEENMKCSEFEGVCVEYFTKWGKIN